MPFKRKTLFQPPGVPSEDFSGQSELFETAQSLAGQKIRQARAAHLSNMAFDASVETERLAREFENDPQGFIEAHDAMALGAVSGASLFTRDLVANEYRQQREIALLQLEDRQESRLAEQHRVDLINGLESIESLALRQSFHGRHNDFDSAREEHEALLSEGLASGLVTATEAEAYRDGFSTRSEEQLMMGAFDRADDKVKWLRTLLDNESLAIEDKNRLIEGATTIMRQESFAEEVAARQSKAEREERHRQGERDATLLYLDDQLTDDTLTTMVRQDRIPSSLARTLSTETADESVPETFFAVDADVMGVSERDIIENPDLSDSDKRKLLGDRRRIEDDQENWRNSQLAQEGSRRIDGALGIVAGEIVLDADKARQVANAKTEWFNRVQALPQEQRESRSLEIADQVVELFTQESKQKQIEVLNELLEKRLAARNEQSEGSSAWQIANGKVETIERAIRELK